jgi:DGQHR domain-containing protein
MKVAAWKYNQQGREMYFTVLSGKTIAAISKVDSVEVSPQGYQREHDQARSLAIARFIEEAKGLVPGAVIMNIRPETNGKFIFTKQTDYETGEFGTAQFPDEPFAWIIDGQHRVKAFEQLSQDILVPVILINGLNRPREAEIFFVVNHKQKNITASLRYHDLMRYASQEIKGFLEEKELEPKDLAYKIVIELNRDPLWKDKINLTGARGLGRAVNLKGFMDALEPVVKDGWFKSIPAFNTQLGHVKTFWTAVSKVWPNALDPQSKSLLTRTFGVFVASAVSVEIFHDCVHLNQFDEDTMATLLAATKDLVGEWDPEGVLSGFAGGGRKAVTVAVEALEAAVKSKFVEMLQQQQKP